MGSLESFPGNHDLRYKLHYLHMEMNNLGVAAYWLAEAIRVERLIQPERKPNRSASSKKTGRKDAAFDRSGGTSRRSITFMPARLPGVRKSWTTIGTRMSFDLLSGRSVLTLQEVIFDPLH